MRTTVLSVFLLVMAAGGCVVKSAKISNIHELDVAETGCAWAQIDQRTVERFVWLLGSADTVTDDLSFHDELYLCCPGDAADPTPVCREARYFETSRTEPGLAGRAVDVIERRVAPTAARQPHYPVVTRR